MHRYKHKAKWFLKSQADMTQLNETNKHLVINPKTGKLKMWKITNTLKLKSTLLNNQ